MIVKPNGIENVVNWQDNGIFADTQKPVADDNYTLAGDVNQDNLYVGYMKEHGLKGKLSLPVLSSLGAITGRQTIGDCEVYKRVNGTTIIKGAVINQNLPDSRISLGFSADENGLQYYNNPNDPMPIKTINMAGLQKWEETDDYIIYLDKDAIVTTVQNYVPGTFDLYNERKNQIEAHMELLKMYEVEWTPEDSEKLLLDINNEQLERIASTPTTMDEPTEIQTFSARAVPTTYECCFRTDKKTGEIYIGEGYENLCKVGEARGFVFSRNEVVGGWHYLEITSGTSESSGFIAIGSNTQKTAVANTSYTIYGEFNVYEWDYSKDLFVQTMNKNVATVLNQTVRFELINRVFEEINGKFEEFFFNKPPGPHDFSLQPFKAKCRNLQITKTSTPKPFVKSVMPSGKLSFVTNATHYSHSFIGKGLEFTGDSPTFYRCAAQPNASAHEYIKPNPEAHSIAIVSTYANLSSKNGTDWLNSTGGNFGLSTGYVSLSGVNYTYDAAFFKQLLIYKGNLTESELKAENEKEINIGAYYHQENSVPLTYGIDSMKSMRVYSPALTDIEIAEEVNKNIYIPENRDGVPNYLGEVK